MANENVEYANASIAAERTNLNMIHIFENLRARCYLNGMYHLKTQNKALHRIVGPGELSMRTTVVLCNLIDGMNVWNGVDGLVGQLTAMEIVLTPKETNVALPRLSTDGMSNSDR